jgi:hypothetical protein
MNARRLGGGPSPTGSVRSTDDESPISSRTADGCLPPADEMFVVIDLRFTTRMPGLQPWRCLCRVFSQMTRTTPLRFTTLHLSQIVLTDARTFISHSHAASQRVARERAISDVAERVN